MRVAWSVAVAGVILSGGCSGGGDPSEQRGPPAETAAAAVIDSPVGGTTTWVRRLGGAGIEGVLAMATANDGTTTLLTGIGGTSWPSPKPDALGLVRLDRSGAVIWGRELPNTTGARFDKLSMAVSPLGNVFVAAQISCGRTDLCFDAGAGLIGGSVIFKFDPRGNFVWQQIAPELASNVAVDANGGALVVFPDAGGAPHLRKYRWDGVKLFDVLVPELPGGLTGNWVVAFDPSANIAIGSGLAFAKLDPSGKLLWATNLAAREDAAGEMVSIGTTAIGTVVAVLSFAGRIEYAGTVAVPVISTGGFIAVAESDGTPRFGRHFTDDAAILTAAVDPAGRLAVLTRVGSCTNVVWRWNLAGELVWNRPLQQSCDLGDAFSTSIATDPTSHDVLVAGGLRGTADFGTGPVASRGAFDDFVVDIAP